MLCIVYIHIDTVRQLLCIREKFLPSLSETCLSCKHWPISMAICQATLVSSVSSLECRCSCLSEAPALWAEAVTACGTGAALASTGVDSGRSSSNMACSKAECSKPFPSMDLSLLSAHSSTSVPTGRSERDTAWSKKWKSSTFVPGGTSCKLPGAMSFPLNFSWIRFIMCFGTAQRSCLRADDFFTVVPQDWYNFMETLAF